VTTPAIAHEAISASAGSGKTFQLAHRYIRLLAGGVDPDRIVALTFSRKAAGEIFDSIVSYLCHAADDEPAAVRTAGLIGRNDTDSLAFLQLLRRFVSHPHRVHVGTLDSFIVGIVRAFPVELGIPVDFEVMDDGGAAAQEARRDALERLFSPRTIDAAAQHRFLEAFKQATFGKEEKGVADALDTFITEHRDYFKILPDPDGWGNPSAIWHELPTWLEEPDSPERAAASLRTSIEKGDYSDPVRKHLLRIVEFAAAYDTSARWDGSLDRSRLFAQLMQDINDLPDGHSTLNYNRKRYTLTASQGKAFAALLRRLMHVEIHRALQQTAGIHRVLASYEALYDSMMRQRGKISFSDAQHLLSPGNPYAGAGVPSRSPSAEGRLYIDYRLDCRLDHWLLDEFQDTSDLQWDVLRNLADEILQDNSGERSLFYVGDVKQAIYGWRGGNARLFGSILDEYGTRVRQRPLNTSFRSAQPIIDAVNLVFDKLEPDPLPQATVQRWATVFHPHRCEAGHVPEDGYVAMVEPQANDDASKPGPAERRQLAVRILRSIQPVARGMSAALLVRSNDEGKAMVDTLRRECPEMPVVHEGKASIRDNPVVELLLSLVKLAAHPGDTFAWRHLQMSPLRRQFQGELPDRGDISLALLADIHTGGFCRTLRKWGASLDDASPLDPFGHRRLADIVGAAAEFDGAGNRSCDAFIRLIDSYESSESASGNAVRVMTVHQSKGLGFDVVVLPELMGRAITGGGQVGFVIGREETSGQPRWALRMPRRIVAEQDPTLAHQLATCDSDDAFDNLCVMYVAMTRAKRALYLVSSFPGVSSNAYTPAAFLKQRLTGESRPTPLHDLTFDGNLCDCLFERGNRDWHLSFEAPNIPARERPHRIPRGFARRPSARARLAMVRPSAEEVSIRSAARLFDREMHDVLAFGSAIHELFQGVEWIEQSDPEAILHDWLASSRETEAVRRDVVSQFKRALTAPAMREALARPTEPVLLWREKHFEVVIDNRLVTGTFDRVTILQDARGRAVSACILDYKSDRADTPEAVTRAIHLYRPQLQMYTQALAQILGLPPKAISSQLAFTRSGEVVEV